MPDFLQPGLWCAGAGGFGFPASVNGTVVLGPPLHDQLAASGVAAIGTGEFICQLQTVQKIEIVASDIYGRTRTLLPEGAAGRLCGKGGHWSAVTTSAVWLDHKILHKRVQGQPQPLAFSRDGSLMACAEWDFGGLFLLNLISGERTDLRPRGTVCEDVYFPSPYGVTWREGQVLHASALGLPAVVTVPWDAPYMSVACQDATGRWWRAASKGYAAVVWPADDPTYHGYGFPSPLNNVFRLDICLMPDGTLGIVWGADAADTPRSCCFRIVDLTLPRINLLNLP